MKVLDAHNFYDENLSPVENMINFAKQHVIKSKGAIYELSKNKYYAEESGYLTIKDCEDTYPLTNIK